jgi:hypothetical protein
MIKNMNPSENLTLSKFCERIESDNSNLWITHRKLKPLILMIWTFFHRINVFSSGAARADYENFPPTRRAFPREI